MHKKLNGEAWQRVSNEGSLLFAQLPPARHEKGRELRVSYIQDHG